MVKPLDDSEDPDGRTAGTPPLLGHVGWRLWQAGRLWMDLFIAGMQEAGHGWFGLAQANLLGCLPRTGTRQGVLAERTGLSKQAVQQLVDDLVAAGIVERIPDPADKRARIVRYTDAGLAAMADGNRIKLAIEAQFAEQLGVRDLARLKEILAKLAQARAGSGWPADSP